MLRPLKRLREVHYRTPRSRERGAYELQLIYMEISCLDVMGRTRRKLDICNCVPYTINTNASVPFHVINPLLKVGRIDPGLVNEALNGSER
jgi:hypothetical protein